MNKSMLLLSALTCALATSPSWSADMRSSADPSKAPTSAQPTQPSPDAAAPSAIPDTSVIGFQAAQAPVEGWTKLQGMVQSVDAAGKTVQIKDNKSGQLLEVPLDKQVKIEKNGKSVNLSQIIAGDTITLSKGKSSAPKEGSSTY